MILPSALWLWMERWLRARRFARAERPAPSAPSWIREAQSFSLLESNPMSPIAAGKAEWVESAGRASRLLGAHAIELQRAAESFEASRARLAMADQFLNAPPRSPGQRHRLMGLLDPSEFAVIEKQRRALSTEREALCLLCASLRQRYGAMHYADPEAPSASLDRPQPLLEGLTLLAYFVSARRLDSVELLLEAGARPDAPCSGDSNALSIAALKADALSSPCPASGQAAGILFLLEAAQLGSDVRPSCSLGARRI